MNIYLQFPQIFDDDKSVINEFVNIQHKIKTDKSIRMYYSKENFEEFKHINEETSTYLLDDIKILRQFIASSNSHPISVAQKDILYIQWNLDEYKCLPCNHILQKIAEEIYNDPSYKYLLINFSNSINACRNKILVFRDAKHLDFPDFFLKINYVINNVEFFEWLKTNHIKNFSLRAEQKFQKRSEIIVKGATVYYEIQEKRYWHLDTFHQYIEYEVYDENGLHIGTANEHGEFNSSNKKEGRKLYL